MTISEDCEDVRLDRAFMALADPVRRRIVARLSRSAATVNELAEPFDISKQAISRHIGVLEQAGLVTRTGDAQRRPVHLNPARLEELTAWIDQYRLTQERRYRQLDALLMRSRVPASRSTPSRSSPTTQHDRANQNDSSTVGTNGYEMVIDVWEATSGRRYRYVHNDPEDYEYAFHGSSHSVEKDSSIIQTFEFEGFPGEVSLDKMTLTDLGDGRCRLDGQSTSPASRRATPSSPAGWRPACATATTSWTPCWRRRAESPSPQRRRPPRCSRDGRLIVPRARRQPPRAALAAATAAFASAFFFW